MKKSPVVLLIFMAVFALSFQIADSVRVRAQTPNQPVDTMAVFSAHYDAIEAGDLDTAMTYLTEDYTSIVLPPPPGTDAVSVGAETNRNTIEYLISDSIDYQ